MPDPLILKTFCFSLVQHAHNRTVHCCLIIQFSSMLYKLISLQVGFLTIFEMFCFHGGHRIGRVMPSFYSFIAVLRTSDHGRIFESTLVLYKYGVGGTRS